MKVGPRGGCTFYFGLISAFILTLVVAACTGSRFGNAQQSVITQPYVGIVTTNASGTVAVTNTFQSVFAATGQLATPATNARRSACAVQNTGASLQYVFFGPLASATIAGSVKLTAGQSVNCNIGGVTLQDQVSITGTATETFYAAQQ